MAKRPLGLAKSKKQKKQKNSGEGAESLSDTKRNDSNQIDVLVDENEDVDDELVQLRGLFSTFLSDKDNQLLLNGVVHECDRLLREQESDQSLKLSDEFHSIYAQALAELTVFLGEEEDEKKKYKLMNEFFEAAVERYRLGAEKFPESNLLSLVHAKIILQRIPLQYISQLSVLDQNDAEYKLYDLLQAAKQSFKLVPSELQLTYEVLLSFYDLLDIIETFEDKEELVDGLDSDDESEEMAEVVLHEDHPLAEIKKSMDSNYDWLEKKLLSLFAEVSKTRNDTTDVEQARTDGIDALFHDSARTLGQLYLKLAEEPSRTFSDLMYDNDDNETEVSKEDIEKAKIAQAKAIPLAQNAIKYLRDAKIDDDPQTWVDVAEAIIDLGNIHDFESKQQEDCYTEAEEILRKANKASHGKYKDILDNLLSKE